VILAIRKIPGTAQSETIAKTYLGEMSHLSPIKVPHGLSTRATAINNSGQIVGSFARSQYPKTLKFSKTIRGFKAFNLPGASATLPSGLNNRGQMSVPFSAIWHTNTGFFASPTAPLLSPISRPR
jgi:hypothetical protein